MRLLLRKNILLSYHKQSGKICTGFSECLYTVSVNYISNKGFKDEPISPVILCRFRKFIGPYSMRLSDYTKAEWKELEKKQTEYLSKKKVLDAVIGLICLMKKEKREKLMENNDLVRRLTNYRNELNSSLQNDKK